MSFVQRLCSLLLTVLMFFPCCTFASDTVNAVLQETEWTWEESSSAVFTGKVSYDELPCKKFLLKLSITTDPESPNPGEVIFHDVNGKKLTLNKQKPEYKFSPEDLKSFDFTGYWKTPDNVYFTSVAISLQVCTEDGDTVLGESRLEVSRRSSDMANQNDGRFRIRADLSQWTLYAAVAAGVLWVLATVRILLNRIKRKKGR